MTIIKRINSKLERTTPRLWPCWRRVLLQLCSLSLSLMFAVLAIHIMSLFHTKTLACSGFHLFYFCFLPGPFSRGEYTYIYKWSGTRFELFYRLPTEERAYGVKALSVDGSSFLAVARWSADSSLIFRWNGTQFELFQEVPSRKVNCLFRMYCIKKLAHAVLKRHTIYWLTRYCLEIVIYQTYLFSLRSNERIPKGWCKMNQWWIRRNEVGQV